MIAGGGGRRRRSRNHEHSQSLPCRNPATTWSRALRQTVFASTVRHHPAWCRRLRRPDVGSSTTAAIKPPDFDDSPAERPTLARADQARPQTDSSLPLRTIRGRGVSRRAAAVSLNLRSRRRSHEERIANGTLSGRRPVKEPRMFAEHRVFHPSDPDAPTTPALRRRLAAAGRFAPDPPHKASATGERCLLCGCGIENDADADRAIQACGSCKSRPEAQRPYNPRPVRGFTDAEKSLIRKIHGYMPAQQLLGILNDRLRSDLGPDATALHGRTAARSKSPHSQGRSPAGDNGWAGLRKLLAQAERAGTLRADQRAGHQRLRRRLLALPKTLDAAEGHSPSAGGGLTHEAHCHPPRRNARRHAQSRRNSDHLDEYATTGLLAVAVGPRGNGKTNAGLLMAEQLPGPGLGQRPDRPRERARSRSTAMPSPIRTRCGAR